jgi:hypothetical protein
LALALPLAFALGGTFCVAMSLVSNFDDAFDAGLTPARRMTIMSGMSNSLGIAGHLLAIGAIVTTTRKWASGQRTALSA